MAPRWSTDLRATSSGLAFLLVRCRKGQRLPIEFALRSLIQPEQIEHVSGPYHIVAKLSGSDNVDWLNDLPGVDSFALLEVTSADSRP